MACIDEVDDPHIGFAGVLPVQPARVLLQGALPRHWHGQHQGVQRRMVESFADQFSGGQKDARRIGWQRVQFVDEDGSLLLRHPPMQHQRRPCQCGQGPVDGVEVLSALGEHQHFTALRERRCCLRGDGFGAGQVVGEMPEHVLNSRCSRQIDAGKP